MKTAEQQAEERYGAEAPHAHGLVFSHVYKREGYATCITERVEPLEERIEQLLNRIGDMHEAIKDYQSETSDLRAELNHR